MSEVLSTKLILAVPEGWDDAIVFILAEVELPPRPARLPPPAGRELGPKLLPRRRGFPAPVVLAAALAARVVDRLAAVDRPEWKINKKVMLNVRLRFTLRLSKNK